VEFLATYGKMVVYTNNHASTGMTPFEALYVITPPTLIYYVPGNSAVDIHLQDRNQLINILRDNLQLAQNRMKLQADRLRTEGGFPFNDWVYQN
jgi:hypothetical protein